jgi:hypothetical protein
MLLVGIYITVTKVEEWTNEDTGVGAAIAAGSQAENGI